LPLPATDMTCDGYNWVIYPKVIRVWLIIIKLNDIRAFRITFGNKKNCFWLRSKITR
jgi:hypothetical protein